ncbi:membrane protein [Neisseria arctica]|uniref:Membrane protein n=1 Tax=Neisseria arctica TaxID=1470200 RepID=A0A0J0YQ03_9NEIS|nr:porin family protein [Neisseria arctica]KLT72210.1 membrane protein [Neisseria arctica]UOO86683.1 porin family protein [Neisseria arctica]
MKKALLAVVALGTSVAAVAAPLATTFTGPAVELGAGVSKTDLKNGDWNEKSKADISLRGNYLVDYGSNWIGGGEVAYKPLSRTIASDGDATAKQKYDLSASYVQGYRVASDALVYGKLGYHYGRFDSSSDKNFKGGINGLGYGLGAKYAVAPNVEVGAEWEQVRYKDGDAKATNNSYMATVGYRF